MDLFNGPFLELVGGDGGVGADRERGVEEREGTGWRCMVVGRDDVKLDADESQVGLQATSRRELAGHPRNLRGFTSPYLPLQTLRVEGWTSMAGPRRICEDKQSIAASRRQGALRKVIGRIGDKGEMVEKALDGSRDREVITGARDRPIRGRLAGGITRVRGH